MPRRTASVSNRADHEPLATAGRPHDHAMRPVRTRRHIPEHRQVRRAGRIRQVPQVRADQGERVLHPGRHRSHEPHHQGGPAKGSTPWSRSGRTRARPQEMPGLRRPSLGSRGHRSSSTARTCSRRRSRAVLDAVLVDRVDGDPRVLEDCAGIERRLQRLVPRGASVGDDFGAGDEDSIPVPLMLDADLPLAAASECLLDCPGQLVKTPSAGSRCRGAV